MSMGKMLLRGSHCNCSGGENGWIVFSTIQTSTFKIWLQLFVRVVCLMYQSYFQCIRRERERDGQSIYRAVNSKSPFPSAINGHQIRSLSNTRNRFPSGTHGNKAQFSSLFYFHCAITWLCILYPSTVAGPPPPFYFLADGEDESYLAAIRTFFLSLFSSQHFWWIGEFPFCFFLEEGEVKED